ncbi:MAG: ATP-binding protein [Deltaproteobacteria bacterium]|nr:ATP-binding protein [Deltaproteobacteria bacterium]
MERVEGMAGGSREDRMNRECGKCRGEKVLITASSAGSEAKVCECARQCAVCRGSRYLLEKDELGREMARMCECEKRRVRARLYTDAGVPGKYAQARLSDRFRDRHNQDAFNSFRLLARDYHKGQKGIVLMGPPGVGKTWLVAGFIYELIFLHGVPVMFRDFFHLLNDLKSGYSQGTPESELIDPLVGVEVLVVDELGKGRNTTWEQNILDVIISQRYNSHKTTIFTTNYTDSPKTTLAERVRPRDGASDGDITIRDTLAERIGPRIHSRLKEMCDLVKIFGPDRRESESTEGYQ